MQKMKKTYFITSFSGVMTNDTTKTAKIKNGDNTFAAYRKKCRLLLNYYHHFSGTY